LTFQIPALSVIQIDIFFFKHVGSNLLISNLSKVQNL